MTTTVRSLRGRPRPIKLFWNEVYVGRPSRWGNPYLLNRDGDRDEVLRKYERWLMTQPALLASLPDLRGKILCCWCYPLGCHADILARLADEGMLGG